MSSSSPSKRKRNDRNASPRKKIGSIESFFKRPQQTKSSSATPSSPGTGVEGSLTDEELARKLQAEWNEEHAKANGESIFEPAPTSTTPDATSIDKDVRGSQSPKKQQSIEEPQPGSTKQGPAKSVLSLQTSTTSEETISLSIPFDQSPVTFDPSTYVTELQQYWAKEGGNASYALLTRGFLLVNGTQSRIKIVDTLVNLLRVIIEADPESLIPAVWLATNAIAPPYVPLELGLGGSAISKSLKKVYGLDNLGLKTLYNKHGDAGDVAFEAKKRQSFTLRKPKPLSIKGVYESLVKIAKSKGTGSQEAKQRIVDKLLQDTRGAEESRYVVRTLVQHLRIGAVKTTMLIALARAFVHSKPPTAEFMVRTREEFSKLKKDQLSDVYAKAEEIVKASYARHPNYDDLVRCLLEIGVSDELLVRCGLTLHIPLRPMLGTITRDLSQMLTKLQGRDFSCEYKYDGQRAQVHCDSQGTVSIFSRHLELMTEKYPDLVSLVPRIRGDGVSSFILEGEVVAVGQDSGELQDFQTLTNRAKKNVEIGSIKVNVCLFAFDLMYLNGEPLLDRSFRERRELLRNLFVEIPNQFSWVKSLDATSADSDTVLEFFKGATDAKCEGIMVKTLDDIPDPSAKTVNDDADADQDDNPKEQQATPKTGQPPIQKGRRKALLSTYEPDKRLESWLKVKKDYSTASDTLDLIPIAGWHGQGRKSKWWSPILLAVRNPETGSLEAVTKCMSGFSDKFYQANKEKYSEDEDNANIIGRPSYVEYAGEPDVWFEPQEVWEVAFADITLSPTYTAAIGLVSEERGLSLRFPRFLRVREDKGVDEASSSEFLANLWRKQVERSQVDDKSGKPANTATSDVD
ncbi:hypothetical protein FQN54_007215 [Arachnomyces sp. PD_36]|nr:hypothetical protein FQN54_007215 [Arachnomyces sp. PD_36]